GVTAAGEDRRRLEQLCRYLLRPPIAQDRLTLLPDGTVVVLLKAPWRYGTTALRFAPLPPLARLAALTPRPRIDVLLYPGILAPHAAGRAAAVAHGRPLPGERPHEDASCASGGLMPPSGGPPSGRLRLSRTRHRWRRSLLQHSARRSSAAEALLQSPAALLPPGAPAGAPAPPLALGRSAPPRLCRRRPRPSALW